MKDKKQKYSSIKKIFNSSIFLVVLILVALFVTSAAARSFYRDYKVKQEISRLKKKVDSLKRERIESMELLKYVSSENFVEKRARTELNLKKKGEKAMVIKRNEEYNLAKDDQKKKSRPNPSKWWRYFFN